VKIFPCGRSCIAVLTSLLFLQLAACGGEGGDSDGAVPERIVSVTLAEARTTDVLIELYSVGRLVSKNAPMLAAEINSRVVDVLVQEGDTVEQGQELILLDTTATELSRLEAQADIQRLKVSIANEERRVQRYRDLKTKDMMPQERLDDAEAKLAVDKASLAASQARLSIAEDRLAKARLVSPAKGVVERRHVSVGDYVKIGGPLMTVTDTQHLRAELPFPETVAAKVRLDQQLFLSSPVAPGLEIEASVSAIRPEVGMVSRALMAIAEIENPGRWRPEATVEARAVVERRPDAIVVPVLSVVRRPAGDVVYVLENLQDNQVRQRLVEVGERQNGTVEIRSGLKSGEIVVADGAHYLSDGARVEVREMTDE